MTISGQEGFHLAGNVLKQFHCTRNKGPREMTEYYGIVHNWLGSNHKTSDNLPNRGDRVTHITKNSITYAPGRK